MLELDVVSTGFIELCTCKLRYVCTFIVVKDVIVVKGVLLLLFLTIPFIVAVVVSPLSRHLLYWTFANDLGDGLSVQMHWSGE